MDNSYYDHLSSIRMYNFSWNAADDRVALSIHTSVGVYSVRSCYLRHLISTGRPTRIICAGCSTRQGEFFLHWGDNPRHCTRVVADLVEDSS